MAYSRESDEMLDRKLRAETQRLIPNDDSEKIHIYTYKRSYSIHHIVQCILTIALLCSIAVVWLYGATKNTGCTAGIEQYYHYSPALEATKPGSRLTSFNRTDWSPFNPNSGNSMEYVDSNWTAHLRVGMMGLTETELRQLGVAPESAVRLPASSGGGYMAYLASHHHLHCVYLLHQSLHPAFYAPRSPLWTEPGSDAAHRASHWNHCVETLRQLVMCNADASVVTHAWPPVELGLGVDLPVPVSENPRRCADWDAHFRWQLERQVPAVDGEVPLRRPPGAAPYPWMLSRPEGYMSMYQ
ncbi:hypothetical protein GGR52DRAFT_593000 [Hypoxylon sp. FL1284]|nr:hypothetical protein GGR52DRAFT_593000 [Hypoxylon sp. FL1284]